MPTSTPGQGLDDNLKALAKDFQEVELSANHQPSSTMEDKSPTDSDSKAATGVEEGQAENRNNKFNYSIIPSRIRQYIPLKIATSTIDGAGRGMFALKDASAGDLLFTIPRPLLNIAGSVNP
jgi:hypothetical protein